MKQFISRKQLLSVVLILISMQVCAQSSTSGSAPEGVVAVDLGLPSGTKWANMNVGATKPEEFGLYFAWGETEGYINKRKGKSYYLGEGHIFSWENYKFCFDKYGNTMSKYCTNSDYGKVDNKKTLDPEDDAAYVNWGSSWRMPTRSEVVELYKNTTIMHMVLNGVRGLKFISKINGNSIFFPAGGRWEDETYQNDGNIGDFWTSSLSIDYPKYAHVFIINSVGACDYEEYQRYYGLTIRPVLR